MKKIETDFDGLLTDIFAEIDHWKYKPVRDCTIQKFSSGHYKRRILLARVARTARDVHVFELFADLWSRKNGIGKISGFNYFNNLILILITVNWQFCKVQLNSN